MCGLLLHKDDCLQLDRATAKVVAKFDKLKFNEPLLRVSECSCVDAYCVACISLTTLINVLCLGLPTLSRLRPGDPFPPLPFPSPGPCSPLSLPSPPSSPPSFPSPSLRSRPP